MRHPKEDNKFGTTLDKENLRVFHRINLNLLQASLGEDEFHGVFDRSRRSRGRSLVKTLDLTDHNSCTRGFRFF